jgi:hypothetical protein
VEFGFRFASGGVNPGCFKRADQRDADHVWELQLQREGDGLGFERSDAGVEHRGSLGTGCHATAGDYDDCAALGTGRLGLQCELKCQRRNDAVHMEFGFRLAAGGFDPGCLDRADQWDADDVWHLQL